MRWPLRLQESKDFCLISNRNFLPVPSKSTGRSAWSKTCWRFSLSFGLQCLLSLISLLVLALDAQNTLKRLVKSFIHHLDAQDMSAGLHIRLYHGFMRKMVFYIQYNQKGTTASFCKKNKNPIFLYTVIQTIWLAFIEVWWYMAFFSRFYLNCSISRGSWHWSAI